MQTQLTQILGTPLYMSPEQADTTSTDIDTRTDIYSLGVLLYELLTGLTPIDEQKFRQAACDEMRRIIREEEPSKPSTRISSLGASASDVSAVRQTDPKRLSQSLRGDLEWIVMKALDKDRNRRYETANGFAADIERFLNDEPVLASPPSRRYQIQKFVRRNRVAVIASSLVGTALVLGIAGTTWGMIWALNESERANNAVLAEKTAKEEVTIRAEAESKTKEEAQQRANELEQVSNFQASQLSEIDAEKMGLDLRNGLLEEVRAALKRTGKEESEVDDLVNELDKRLSGANFTNLALDMLDSNIFQRALTAIDRDFGDQPLVQAQLLGTVGDSLHKLGLLDAAVKPTEQALEIHRAELGEKHPDTLTSINDLGSLLRAQGKLSEAEPLYREALDAKRHVLGDEHPDTLTSINNLGMLIQAQGKPSEAEPLFREALEGRRHLLGDEHRKTLVSINNLARLLQAQGKLSEAEPLFREALEGRRHLLGDEHPHTLISINDMAELLLDQGKLSEAEPLFREALEISRQKFGDDNPKTLSAMATLSLNLLKHEKYSDAEPLLRECLQGRQKALEEGHWLIANTQSMLGQAIAGQKRFADAEPLLIKGYENMEPPTGAAVRKDEALQRIIDLYNAWHKTERDQGYDKKSETWRAKVEQAKEAKK